MSEIKVEVEKVITNPDKSKLIRDSHAKRQELLQAIRNADPQLTLKTLKDIDKILTEDSIDIMKRIEGDTVRSYKNLMLSHNSMYALVAEVGGLDPVLSHYMTEKYAILIERAENIRELEKLHLQFLKDYCTPNNRGLLKEDASLSAKVHYYISTHFMNDLEIRTIADNLFVTKEHLMRTFKRETGKTINEVIKEKRLEEAVSLLQNSHLSVTDIAAMSGFNSVHYFSKVFKKAYGISPSEYEKKFRQE